jgi:tetratricopeptide (TPR) repeat protein
MNLSRRGEAGQAQRSLGRAFDDLNSATTVEPAERWSFVNPSFVAACGASVSLTLGQLQQAEHYGQQAMEATRTDQTRNYAMRRLSLARIYLEMGELDAACAHASSVLTVELHHYTGREFSTIRNIAIDLYRGAFVEEIDKPFWSAENYSQRLDRHSAMPGFSAVVATPTRNPSVSPTESPCPPPHAGGQPSNHH